MEETFSGFEPPVIAKSQILHKALRRVVETVEGRLYASTPRPTTMDLQHMDYDSGYMSHHQESSDSSLEIDMHRLVPSKPIFLSEDALLEQPELGHKGHAHFQTNSQFSTTNVEIINDEVCAESRRMFVNLNDSETNTELDMEIISPTISSVHTNVSTFTNDSDSDKSIIIPVQEQLVYKQETSFGNLNNTTSTSIMEQSDMDISDPFLDISDSNHVYTPILTPLKKNKRKSTISKAQFSVQIPHFDAEEDKENNRENACSNTPLKPTKPIEAKYSPDLFEDEVEAIQPDVTVKELPADFIAEERFVHKKDLRLLRRVQTGLSGVLPPPSLTTLRLTVGDMLAKLEERPDLFWTQECATKLNTSEESVASDGSSRSLLVTASCLQDFDRKEFPEVLEDRFHGLHYNRSKISEEFEELCAKYAQRCVGSETQSSCTIFENTAQTPGKRRLPKNRWQTKSPGRRLSHLARRRITFSSANLQAGGLSNTAGTKARQILLDGRRKTSPRKRTPRKTPQGKSPRIKTSRTPSSSAKKKLALRFRELQGEFEQTVPSTSSEHFVVNTKRALFQSPGKSANKLIPSTSGMSKGPTKRALFTSPLKSTSSSSPRLKTHVNSPRKRSPVKKYSPFKKSPRKRKRTESGGDCQPMPKLSRSVSMSTSSSEVMRADCENVGSRGVMRCRSEVLSASRVASAGQIGELSEAHKKKLQWAVYESLRAQNITTAHAQFKLYASILARVTRKFFLSSTTQQHRPESVGTSERMLRIARHHVYAVLKGKSVDEIIKEHLKQRAKIHSTKPHGYVALEEFHKNSINISIPSTNSTNNLTNSSAVHSNNSTNVLQDRLNTMESVEKRKQEQLLLKSKNVDLKVDRIKKVINFGDDNR